MSVLDLVQIHGISRLSLIVIILLLFFYATKPQCSSVCDNCDGNGDASRSPFLVYGQRINDTFDHFNSRIAAVDARMIQLNETMRQYYISIDRSRSFLRLEAIMKELFIRQSVVHSSIIELQNIVVQAHLNHNNNSNHTSDRSIENIKKKVDDIHSNLQQASHIRDNMSTINTMIINLLNKISTHHNDIPLSRHKLFDQLTSLQSQSQRVNESIMNIESSLRNYQYLCQLEPIYEQMHNIIAVQVQQQLANFTCYDNTHIQDNITSFIDDNVIHDYIYSSHENHSLNNTFATTAVIEEAATSSARSMNISMMIPSMDYALSTAGGRIIRDLTASSYFPVEYHLDAMLRSMLVRNGYEAFSSYVPAWTGLSLYKMAQLNELIVTPDVVLTINKPNFVSSWPMLVRCCKYLIW